MSQKRYALIAMLITVVAGIAVLVSQTVGDDSSEVTREAEQENDTLAVRPDGGPPLSSVDARREALGAASLDGAGPDIEADVLSPPPTVAETAELADLTELILRITTGEELRARFAALHELAGLDGEAVERVLAEIANDPTLPVRLRREALLLLSGKPGDVALETFLSFLQSKEVKLRLAAAQGLGVLGLSEAFGDLSAALSGESSVAVARAIVQSMSRIGAPEYVDALLAFSLADDLPSGVSRDEILGALAGVSNPEAVSALSSALNVASDTESRYAIVSALAEIADPGSFDVLLAIVNEDLDLDTRCQAMQGLGLIGDPRALPALESLAESTSVKEQSYAQTAIERIESGEHY